MAAAPAPKKNLEGEIDDVLAAIDRDLSKVHRIVKKRTTVEMPVPEIPASSRAVKASRVPSGETATGPGRPSSR